MQSLWHPKPHFFLPVTPLFLLIHLKLALHGVTASVSWLQTEQDVLAWCLQRHDLSSIYSVNRSRLVGVGVVFSMRTEWEWSERWDLAVIYIYIYIYN